jgi:DNA-binding NtrC family response regulator
MAEEKTDSGRKLKVLVVDDEQFMLQAWKKILQGHDCEIQTLSDGTEAVSAVERWRPDVTVLDIRMPNVSGLELLKEIRSRDLPTEVVMMTAYASVETAVEAVKAGAYDYLTKPFTNIDAAALTVMKAGRHRRLVQRNQELESLLDLKDSFEGLVGSSPQMKRVYELVEGVAYSSSTVLLQGESGTGKELVARAIHHRSPRRSRSFVAVNCSALTDTLLESELFGHEKGSFTGATNAKRGLFEVANGGTIFLDEIGQVPLPTQVKLLRVLQEGELKRVGSSENRQVDVRVIAATNVDLARATQEGAFREDLFYRLNVIAIQMPPLRQRVSDIPLLALHFLRKYNARTGKSIESIHPEVMETLERHAWPGNVRELENVVERAVVLSRGQEILARDLPENLRESAPARRDSGIPLGTYSYRKAKEIALGEFDRRYIAELLTVTSGNVSQASRQAGMDRSNFRRVMKKYGINPVDFTGKGQMEV